ncbi:CAAX amino terminal protease self- immunity [compost metagenome]
MKKIFRIQFDQEALQVLTKRDGWAAILYYLYSMIFLFMFGVIMFRTQLISDFANLFTNPFFARITLDLLTMIIQFLPIFIYLLIRKQSLRTVGLKFNGTDFGKSLIIGILCSLPFILPQLVNFFLGHITFQHSTPELIYKFLYFLITIAFVEEIGFRGFIQTRIFSLIRNKYVGILFVGFLFAIMHIPFQMFQAKMGLLDFIMYDYIHLLITWVLHMFFVYLYTRNNDLVAPVIAHTLINFVPSVIY